MWELGVGEEGSLAASMLPGPGLAERIQCSEGPRPNLVTVGSYSAAQVQGEHQANTNNGTMA